MNLQIIHFQGTAHVVTPYQKGTYIREDAFWRQFHISCLGELSFMEDNPIYGTWEVSYGFDLGVCGLIEDAIRLAENLILDHHFDLPEDAIDFSPNLIQVRDDQNRLVLAGRALADGVRWRLPASSEAEARQIAEEVSRLHREGSFESGWDNFSTARRLHLEADDLAGRLVDRFWREHTRAALASKTS